MIAAVAACSEAVEAALLLPLHVPLGGTAESVPLDRRHDDPVATLTVEMLDTNRGSGYAARWAQSRIEGRDHTQRLQATAPRLSARERAIAAADAAEAAAIAKDLEQRHRSRARQVDLDEVEALRGRVGHLEALLHDHKAKVCH